jgi:hypothetical protein
MLLPSIPADCDKGYSKCFAPSGADDEMVGGDEVVTLVWYDSAQPILVTIQSQGDAPCQLACFGGSKWKISIHG